MIKSTESGDTQYSVLGLVNSQAGWLALISAVSRFCSWLLPTIIPPLRSLPAPFPLTHGILLSVRGQQTNSHKGVLNFLFEGSVSSKPVLSISSRS